MTREQAMTALAPDAHGRFETDTLGRTICPIWDGLKVAGFRYPSVEQNIHDTGSRYHSSRAGGPFLLMPNGAVLLDWESPGGEEQKSLTDRQKVNLSYWIYQDNLDNGLLDERPNRDLQEPDWFPGWMKEHDRRDRVPKLGQEWVENHRDRTPSAKDRMLTFLRELIRSDAAGEQRPDEDLLMAAGGCRDDKDLSMLKRHVVEQGWTGSRDPQSSNASPYRINFSAHLYVDKQIRKRGGDQQAAA